MRHQRRRIGGVALVFAGTTLVVAAGVVALARPNVADWSLSRADQSARLESQPQGKSHHSAGQASAPPLPVELPVPKVISIPAIDVRAAVIPLGLETDGTLEVPSDFSETGWFRGGPEPGEPGASVVVGHVDSKAGPAVFYHLRALRRGDLIKIGLQDGSIVWFAVTSSLSTPKNDFPTDLVYRHGGAPTLALITCDGAFDQTTGHYRDNYIVFAKLKSVDMVAS